MPSGYTAPICEGEVMFRDFLFRCAKAFGAFVSIRDEPLDESIPDQIEPSIWQRKQLQASFESLIAMESWDNDAWKEATITDYVKKMQRRQEAAEKNTVLLDRYNAMLEKARAWQPPTDEHQGLKDFMIKQLQESIGFDCSTDFTEPRQLNSADYRHKRLTCCLADIEYNAKECLKELNRAKERTEWIQALKGSLDA